MEWKGDRTVHDSQNLLPNNCIKQSLVSQETGNKKLKEEDHKAGILPLTASAETKIQNQSLPLN